MQYGGKFIEEHIPISLERLLIFAIRIMYLLCLRNTKGVFSKANIPSKLIQS